MTDGTKTFNISALTAGGVAFTAKVTNPMDAIGQLIYGGASGVPTKLAAGVAGQVLQSGGAGAPSWASVGVPSGTIMAYAGNAASSPPTGWLLCNGQEVSKTTYADLFAAIGTTWDTATNPLTGSAQASPSTGNFRVPNLQGVFLRGVADYSGSGAYNTANDVTLGAYRVDQVQEFGVRINTQAGGGTGAGTDYPTTGSTGRYESAQIIDSGVGALRTGYETAPKQYGIYWIIKT